MENATEANKQAYFEGLDAWDNGDENPYETLSAEAYAWNRGYAAAEKLNALFLRRALMPLV
jgi:hypothetical protein